MNKTYFQGAGEINEPISINWKERALIAEAKLADAQLVSSIAKDIINLWPTISINTVDRMTNKVAILKEAVELADK